MKTTCPGKENSPCNRELKKHEERRYGIVPAHEVDTVHVRFIYLFRCKGKDGCGHTFLMKQDIPADGRLGIEVSQHDDWESWKRGKRAKPIIPKIGTTCSSYTYLARQDPFYVFEKILNYERLVALPILVPISKNQSGTSPKPR